MLDPLLGPSIPEAQYYANKVTLFLNDTKGPKLGREKLLKIVRDMVAIEEASLISDSSSRRAQLKSREASLRKQLSVLRFKLDLFFFSRRSSWDTIWTLKAPGGGANRTPTWLAFDNLLKLAAEGRLNRLRQCGQCQKWFYAKLRTQKFCSFKCQQKNYTQSPEWKEHRRKYMQRYYQRQFAKGRSS
jgi:hypothetical protein